MPPLIRSPLVPRRVPRCVLHCVLRCVPRCSVLRLGRLAAVAVIVATLLPGLAAAQVRPDLAWRTLATEHFRIHFTADLEALARRTAQNAEAAWTRLAEELAPPRGPVEIVVADNMDVANGYATPFPTNRIVIYARPPVEVMAFRNHEDWNRLLVTHELTHVFHLDRVRGAWALAQRVFGRAAPFFPNMYAPRWVTEGLAVHYESRLGGGGRLAGTEFPMFVRAAALAGELPSLDELSLATPFFPSGDLAYIYGGYALSRGDTAHLGRYVDAASGRLLPWRHDANARAGFGVSFSERWRAWRDSVTRAEAGVPAAGDRAETLTRHGFVARFPRFVSDEALVYVANDARRVTGLYALPLRGERRRLGRRNGVDVSAPLGGGRTVQGELDYRDPYSLQGDLFRGDGLGRRRVTDGARLSSPDAHVATGRVVAVRTEPGTTSLVLVDPARGRVTGVVAQGSLDRTWAEPRFSRAGDRLAAVRWARGGRNSVVVLDLEGRELRAFAPRAAARSAFAPDAATPRGPRLTVVSAPVWEPGDSTLLFVSDHDGRPMIYRGDVRTGAYGLVWASATGLNTPDVSPDGRRVAAVELRADGYHVVVRELSGAVPLTLPAADTAPDPTAAAGAAESPPEAAGAASQSTAPATPYSPWRLLRPRWWLPVLTTTDPGTLSIGAMASAVDVVGRHAWAAEASVEPERGEFSGGLAYAYAGLGVPVIHASLTNEWDHGVIRDNAGAFAGYLGRREQRATIDVVLERPRVRFSSYLVLGGEVEGARFRSYPASLLPLLNNGALTGLTTTQAVRGTFGFSTMQHPANAVSPADGLSGHVTHRERFGIGVAAEDVRETIGELSAARSLPLPGFSRHVVALRGAYGVTSHRTTAALDVGGVSGSALEVVPGIVLGGGRRTFGVRGFNGGTLLGVRAAAASAEYRAPLALLGRGVGLLPIFFQKASLTAFADAGSAWCSFPVDGSFICPSPLPARTTIASVGGELGVDAAVQYDFTYRFRVGFAQPVRGESLAQRSSTVYFTLGSTF